MRNVLRETHKIKAFRAYIQPKVQYGVLLFGSTRTTAIRERDKNIKRIAEKALQSYMPMRYSSKHLKT